MERQPDKLNWEELLAQNTALRIRLEEAEETLRAIREGEVDAVIVSGSKGDRVFALTEGENLHRLMVETMSEAGIATSVEGTVLFCNQRACGLLGVSQEQMLGHSLNEFVVRRDAERLELLLRTARRTTADDRILFVSQDGTPVPMHIWASLLGGPDGAMICLVGTDLSQLEGDKDIIAQLREQQEALRQSEERMQQALSVSHSFTFEWQPATDEVLRSASCETILGLGGEEACHDTGQRFFQRVHPEDRERFVRMFNELAPGADAYRTEYRFERGDGRVVILEEMGQATFDAAGRLKRLVGVTTDITERRQAREALAAAHRQTQNIIDNTTAIIYAFDLEERFVVANATVAKLFNTTPAQLIGKRRHDFMPHADADWHEANDRKVIDAGRALDFEERNELPGRSIIWLTTKFPLRDAQGRIYAVAGISTDITERKQAQEALIRNEKTFSELIEGAPFGIYIVDSEFRIAQMNRGSQTGAFCNVRPIIGRPFGEAMHILWPDDVAEEIIGHFRHTLDTGEPYYSPRFTNPRHDVEIVESYEWELHRMMLPDGQYGVICYYYDSTMLREAQEALRQSQEELRRHAETLEERVKERTAELAKTVVSLREEVDRRMLAETVLEKQAAQLRWLASELTLAEQRERQRLARVLHDDLQQMMVAAKFRLAPLRREQSEHVRLAAAEVDELMRQSIEASRSLAGDLCPPVLHEKGLTTAMEWLGQWMNDKYGLAIELSIPEPLKVAAEDIETVMFHSMRELLFNVVKHARTKSVHVLLEEKGGRIRAVISDDGVGFDASKLTSLSGVGGGFGLFSIQERFAAMGGRLSVESAPGKGCRTTLLSPPLKERRAAVEVKPNKRQSRKRKTAG